MKKNILKNAAVVTILAAVFFSFGSISRAAVLTLGPQITLNTEGESINAIELHLSFDPRALRVRSISDGSSIVNFWIEKPAFSNDRGTIDLLGIIPGGINTMSGVIATINAVPSNSPLVTQGFDIVSASVLLNDGRGTPAKLRVATSSAMTALPSATVPAATDTSPPNPFTPEIARDPNLFGGKYFLVFAATDDGSGIDYYEVVETAHGAGGNISGWERADSPYLLKDQTLTSDIYVRAVDRAGNFRTVKMQATSVSAGSPWRLVGFAILLVLVIIFAALFRWRKKE